MAATGMTAPDTQPDVATEDELLALADRVERATGSDRELDIAIHTLIDPQHVAYMDADYAEMRAAIEAMGPEAIQHRLPSLRSHTHNPPRYTASLDAAMTLVPSEANSGGEIWRAEGYNDPGVLAPHVRASAWVAGAPRVYAATPALALAAAALRARANQVPA